MFSKKIYHTFLLSFSIFFLLYTYILTFFNILVNIFFIFFIFNQLSPYVLTQNIFILFLRFR
ncbi:MAG: hypothetical protein E7213_09455 [Clostridium sp.]|nr:hypothetical protein [Clostridium sp.]